MDGNRAPWRRAGLCVAAFLLLGACGGHHLGFGGHDGDDSAIHAFPDHYKTDILSAMHAYLNDPSGIRDASISEPMLKSISAGTRYLVCLRFNGKQNNGTYTGAQAEATVGAGLGANVLIGGSNRSVALQPLSFQGQLGLDIAAGIGSLELHLVQ